MSQEKVKISKPRPNNWLKEEIENLEKDHSDIYGVELTYKELVMALGISYKTGGAKINQLEDLSCVFDMLVVEKPKRYIIQEYLGIEWIPTPENEKFFESAVMNLFLQVGKPEIYYTNNQLLEYFGLVNENYRVLKHPKYKGKLSDEAIRFREPAEIIGNILTIYMNRAIKKLEKRNKVMLRRGFCLLKKKNVYLDEKGNEHYTIQVVPVQMQTDTEYAIMRIEEEATCMFGLKGSWVPPSYKKQYREFVDEKIGKVLGSDYVGFYKANILTSPLEIARKEVLSYKGELNKVAIDKIRNTKTLDNVMLTYGHNGRIQMIDEIIRIPPVCDYKAMLKENEKKGKNHE